MNVTSTSVTNPVTGAITTITVVHRHQVDYKLIVLAVLAVVLIGSGLYLWRKPVKKK